MNPLIKLPLAGFLPLLVAVTMAEAANRVFVKPEASDDYLIERAREPSKKVQTYQFMKGKYHPGNRLDPGMEKVTF